MKCSMCREIKPWLTKIGRALLCEECKQNSEHQLQRNDVVIKDEARTLKDTSPTENCNQHLVGTTNIKIEPVAMGDEQDQTLPVGFSNGAASHAIKPEISDSDTMDSEQCDNMTEQRKAQNVDGKSTEEEKINCKLCSYSCSSRHVMLSHLKDYHPVERIIGCSICLKRCHGKTLYQQHIREKHDGFGADCKICLEMFREPGEVKRHRKHCLGRLLFTCNSCDKSYVSKESILKHVDGQCSSATSKVAAFSEKRIKQLFFTCSLCNDGRAFEKEPYWKHINEVHNGHVMQCKYCPSTFMSRTTLSRHMKFDCKVHIASERFPRQNVQCPKCAKRFVTQRKLDIHVKTAHRPVSCNVYQIRFKNYSSLKYHREKKHPKPNLQCSHCQKTFTIAITYYRHLKSHRK